MSTSSSASTRVVVRAAEFRLVAQIPVASEAQPGRGVEAQRMRWWQLADGPEHAAWRGNKTQTQVLIQRLEIELGQSRIKGEKSFDFRGKHQLGTSLDEVQWLLTEAVARRKQTLLTHVPESKGKHAPQALYAVLAKILIQVDDDFGIAVGGKPVPFLL